MSNFKKHILVSVALYAIGYSITSFITWSLINPFAWILKINQYSETIRILILLNIIIFNVIVKMIVNLLNMYWKKWQ